MYYNFRYLLISLIKKNVKKLFKRVLQKWKMDIYKCPKWTFVKLLGKKKSEKMDLDHNALFFKIL
jgi:hypothetical protein